MKKVKEFPQFLRTLEIIPDGMVLIDQSGKIVFVNRFLLLMFGYNKEELINQSVEVLMPEEYRKHHVGHRESYQSQPYTRVMNADADIVGLTKDGRTLNLDVMLSPVNANGNSYVLGAIRDVSAYKEMEESLLQSHNTLKSKVSELNSFFYNTSHNLKGPISSALGLANLGIMESKDKTSKIYFEYILETLTGLEATFNKISFLTKLDGRQLNPTSIEFEKIVSSACTRLAHMEGFERIDISIINKLKNTFHGDVEVLECIVYHLFENSVKYQDYSNELPNISIKLEEQSSKLHIDIFDNGVEIPEPILNNVFRMFFRGSERSRGSGMGLYLVKKAVARLNGEIEVVSKPGSGTTFKITIPNQKLGKLS
jgi:PAS domain S-box-containing protein